MSFSMSTIARPRRYCAAVSSLRVAGQKAVISADPTAGLPILILAGTPEEQRVKFEQAVASAQIAPINAAVLGHRLSAVQQCSGTPKGDSAQTLSGGGGNRLRQHTQQQAAARC